MSNILNDSTRRTFLGGTFAAGVVPALAAPSPSAPQAQPSNPVALAKEEVVAPPDAADPWWPARVDLAPARWIWLPSQRVLPNTFVLFRREITLSARPTRATAWIAADSRYRISVNGQRLQWGPAPCDPRQLDVDPVDLSAALVAGKNVIGVEVLFYGFAEGSWPGGKPGLLLLAQLEMPDGVKQTLVSDDGWSVHVDRAHRPGQHKRWFLRSLQEDFDARLHPEGWDRPGAQPAGRWMSAQALDCPADKPVACGQSGPWAGDTVDRVNPDVSALRLRQIPPLRETLVPVARLTDAGTVEWTSDPDDWFDLRIPDSFRLRHDASAASGSGPWQMPATPAGRGVYATFALAEQVVGWPYFTIDAPAGTIVELMPQESHDPAKTAWLDTHLFSWSRFVCKEGENHFETFDYECLRWLQLHVHNASRPVTLRDVGVRRRQFAWPHEPHIQTSDATLQRLFNASVNTLRNSVVETVVDGMGRERQQYSGDCGHQLHAVRYAFGETRPARRYLRTYSEGLTKDGYFLDCWPAGDRLTRIPQKEMDAAYWGPLLDHGVGFNFDCWNHYMETGEREAVVEPYPQLVRFAEYLLSLRSTKAEDAGLLPVENLGIPTVWIDHNGYKQQRHRQCAFNLYTAAMFSHTLAPLAEVMGEPERARTYRRRGDELLAATVRRFWSARHGTFINNLPWAAEEHELRMCDRSLSTAVLFDQCPGGNTAAAVRALVECPPEMGFSYPANQGWRLWALAKHHRVDVILRELRSRWANMRSVKENNALQEDWDPPTDTAAEWSHCPLAPLYVTFMDLAGIRPLTPGFAHCRIQPQLGDLPDLALTAWTPHGPIEFSAQAEPGGHSVHVKLPAGCEADVVVPTASRVPGTKIATGRDGLSTYRLASGQAIEFHLARA